MSVAAAGRPRGALGLLASLLACFGAAGLGGYWTTLGLGPWFDGLRKPSWNPPASAFGPVWTLLYVGMAVAAWRVWRVRGWGWPIGLFGVQLALNAAWTGLFFALRQPGWALVEIIALWLTIAATTRAFARSDRLAAVLMLPYLAWVSFAGVLNAAIWRLNS